MTTQAAAAARLTEQARRMKGAQMKQMKQIAKIVKRGVEHQQKSWDAGIELGFALGLTQKQCNIACDFISSVAARGKLTEDFNKQARILVKRLAS